MKLKFSILGKYIAPIKPKEVNLAGNRLARELISSLFKIESLRKLVWCKYFRIENRRGVVNSEFSEDDIRALNALRRTHAFYPIEFVF